MRTVMISKHIHSCLASFSSKDVCFQIFLNESELDFVPLVNHVISSKKYPFLDGEIVAETTGDTKFSGVYLESDKTFYNKGGFNKEWHNTDDFKILIGEYVLKGWTRQKHAEKKAYDAREEKRNEVKSKKAGLVLWHSYDSLKKQPLKVYQGGFSDEVFNTPKLQQYISSHSAFGWIGDSGARRKEHDILIEKGLKERGLNPEQMYNWISSSDGRHFADTLFGYTLEEQLLKIEKNLNRIYNRCLIYGDERHLGTMKSTGEVATLLEADGLLLQE